jgi:hypothetical protein
MDVRKNRVEKEPEVPLLHAAESDKLSREEEENR